MKTSKNSGVNQKETTDYFSLMRTSEPIESYGIDELRRRIEAERKRKAQQSGNNTSGRQSQ
jgi:hypothetical protein